MSQKRALIGHDDRPYETGFGKPPVDTRFKKGQSGNHSGRPKAATRFDSIIKTELERTVRATIDGKGREISKREAMVRRLFAKALRGDIRAAELFLKHVQKREPPIPQPAFIIKYYKDDRGRSQPTRDSKDPGDTKEAIGSSHDDGASAAAQSHPGRDTATSEPTGKQQASPNDQAVARGNDGPSSSSTGATGAATEPHAARNATNGEASSPGTKIRMRAPKPHHNFYVSPAPDGSCRYCSDANGIIENVHPDHFEPLRRGGCVCA